MGQERDSERGRRITGPWNPASHGWSAGRCCGSSMPRLPGRPAGITGCPPRCRNDPRMRAALLRGRYMAVPEPWQSCCTARPLAPMPPPRDKRPPVRDGPAPQEAARRHAPRPRPATPRRPMTTGPAYRAQLALRRLLPESLKTLGRLARLAFQPPPPPAPPIPQAQLEGCVLLADRIEMLRRFPKGGRVCELGTYRGDYARMILDVVQPDELHLVDVSFALCAPEVIAHPAVQRHETTTVAYLGSSAAADFDWIYVDADHGYDAVVADIASAKRRVKPGGLLVFNDFARIVRPGFGVFGVHQAVCEFAAAEGWAVAYLSLGGEALYDIALRRPAG